MKMKNLLTAIAVVMFFTTGLTYGQHQARPLPIYRYMIDGYPDNLNVLDSSAASLALDTTTLPFPAGPALTWGGWDTAHISGPYNWTISHYTVGSINELKGNGYSSTLGNLLTDQWYISPYFNTNLNTGVTFSFSSKCAKYAGPVMQVMVSTSFRNEVVNPTQWTALTSANIPAPNGTSSSAWLKSNINLDSYKGDSVCIAFRYTSTTGNAATYYVDSIKILGTLVGINDIKEAAGLVNVYPSPVKSIVNISNPSMINKVEIYNMVGELVSANENVNNNECSLNIAKLPQGIYITKIQLKNGITVSKKIVKE